MFLTQKKAGWKSGVYLRDDAWMSQGKGRARRCTRPWSVPVFVHVDFSLRLQLYAHSRTQWRNYASASGELDSCDLVSFDLIVSCSSCRGQSLIHTLNLQKKHLTCPLCVCVLLVQVAACTTAILQWVPTPMAAHRSWFRFCCTCPWVHRQSCLCLLKFICSFVGFERRQKESSGSGNRAMFLAWRQSLRRYTPQDAEYSHIY